MKNHGGEPIIPFSGVFESKLADMPDDERDKYCKEVGAQSAIDKIVTTGFRAIQLIYFFTAGPDEVKCWQIRRHTKAPQVSTHTTIDKNPCVHQKFCCGCLLFTASSLLNCVSAVLLVRVITLLIIMVIQVVLFL